MKVNYNLVSLISLMSLQSYYLLASSKSKTHSRRGSLKSVLPNILNETIESIVINSSMNISGQSVRRESRSLL
jgi:hypothetical protein